MNSIQTLKKNNLLDKIILVIILVIIIILYNIFNINKNHSQINYNKSIEDAAHSTIAVLTGLI